MISKTQISKRTQKKTNPNIVETIEIAKKNNLLDLAKKLSGPLSNYSKINVDEINRIKEGRLLIIGKVLGSGKIENKKTIIALSFSKQAYDKLKKANCEIKTIKEELKNNKDLKGVKVI